MKLRRSEILDNFAKIALEKGLIDNKLTSKAEAMSKEDKYKDSEWKKNIEALYGVKLDNEDILDKAHPKPVVTLPAYDNVNGLVENLKERHNIMVGIVNKMPNGAYVGTKYASAYDDLLKELIKIGYSMDNKNIHELRVLADSCSERFTKTAFAPLAIAGGIAAVLGLIAIINHTTPSDQGVINNCEKAIAEIEEVKPKLPQISKNVDALLSDLKALEDLAKQYNNLGGIDASTPEKLMDAANKEKSSFDVVKKYKSACSLMSEKIPKYIDLISSYHTQTERTWDWWQKIKNVTELLTGTDQEDAVLALQTLKNSLEDSVKEANNFMDLARKQEPSLVAALSKLNTEEPNQHTESKSNNNSQPANHQKFNPNDDIDPEEIWKDNGIQPLT